VFDGAATPAATCPSCDATIGDRSARWCGSCGALLRPPGTATDGSTAATSPRSRRRPVLVGGLAVVVVVALVVAGERVLDGSSPGSDVRDAAIEAPDADALDDVQQRGPTSRRVRTSQPTCGARSADCFLWSVEFAPVGWSHVVAGDTVVVYQQTDGALVGRDLHDGSVRWTAPGVVSADTWRLVVADDLVVHRDEDGLVARSMTSGEVRWRHEELPWLVVREAAVQDDLLVIAGDNPVSDHDDVPPGAMVGGFDAATGELRWHRSGVSTGQGLGGIGIVLTDEGRLVAHDPGGGLRWEVIPELEGTPAHVWAFGHVVSVGSGHGEERQHLIGDGTPLDGHVMPMAVDEHHTLLVETDAVAADGTSTRAGRLMLVDGDGPVWRTDGVSDDDGCFGNALLLPETVEVSDCRGGATWFDRADGTVLSRSAPTEVDASDGREVRSLGRWRLGPYEVVVSHDASQDELMVRDVARDTELASFPSGTWPVGDHGLGGVPPDGDGVLLMAGERWLTAIDLDEPDADAPSG
jgi:outer membrane protein assembly factor BamB